MARTPSKSRRPTPRPRPAPRAAPAAAPPARSTRQDAGTLALTEEKWTESYVHVRRDLLRIVVLGALMFGALILSWFVL